MSVRPKAYLIFGINDFRGSLDYESLERPVIIQDDNNSYVRYTFKSSDVIDHIYWGGFHEGHNKILGMIVLQSHCDSDLLRVLSVLHPEYECSGFIEIDTWQKEDHLLYAKQAEKIVGMDDIEFQWEWFYPSVIEQHTMWPVWAYCTRFILAQAGIEVDYKKLRLFFVWDWT